MIKKRLSTAVVIRDDYAVQSFGFKRYLPIGKPENVIENLSWWGSDEILIFDIKSKNSQTLDPNFSMISKICERKLSTPITYSGRIRDAKSAIQIINLGVERIGLGNILFENQNEIKKISEVVGSQAIILILNFFYKKNQLYLKDIKHNKEVLYSDFENNLKSLNNFYSEILLVDIFNEGSNGNFNLKILDNINLQKKMILYGGMLNIGKINKCFKFNNVASIAVGNQLNFKEHAYQSLKKKLNSNFLRPYFYNY